MAARRPTVAVAGPKRQRRPSAREQAAVQRSNGKPNAVGLGLGVQRHGGTEARTTGPCGGRAPWSLVKPSKINCMDDAAADPLVMPLDLLREITNDFSEERKLGSGTFGKVYKGVYQDGKTIAVKMLYDMPGLDDVQFQNEFKHLRRLQHQNIVRLVGYCLNIQEVQVMYEGNLVIAEKTHRALCLEYMCNGSLAKHLSDECDRYDWQKSYRIIKGICQGLNYLHNELNPPIFHLDLKPDNVLLDESMVPRIADFGISRLLTDGHTVATKTSLGTFGYLPPEYIKSGLISPKFDIFSLGVIILKILAGRECYSNSSEMSSQEFINLVHENLSSRLCEGPNLRKAHCEQIKICVEIGISCREDDRHKRPPIKEIVDRLNETETKCIDASRKDSLIDQDDLEPFGDVGSLDDNVESFLSNDEGAARDFFAAFKIFTFSEINCWRSSNSKIVCCNFSSDGKILASAGYEKKAVLCNMDTFQTQYLPEEHGLIITDVRFRHYSTQLATSSFDRTVKLWNIADPAFSQHTFAGHNYQVTSLDFHPKMTNLLCSCDGSGEIRYWNVTQHTCIRVAKGGTAQIRFQPRTGQFLAAASENVVSIFDVETHTKKYTLQGHNTDVRSVCWDNTGKYLASVSQDQVKVWSVSSGECIHEVSSNGNKFHSCVFHPSYTKLLVIGCYQSLELWNMVKNQSMTVLAHDGLIASLAQSPVTGMMASASHDNSVKLWK